MDPQVRGRGLVAEVLCIRGALWKTLSPRQLSDLQARSRLYMQLGWLERLTGCDSTKSYSRSPFFLLRTEWLLRAQSCNTAFLLLGSWKFLKMGVSLLLVKQSQQRNPNQSQPTRKPTRKPRDPNEKHPTLSRA